VGEAVGEAGEAFVRAATGEGVGERRRVTAPVRPARRLSRVFRAAACALSGRQA
jgi:hypothetical protein